MVRQYIQVTDEQRSELVRLIHQSNYSIARASKATGIPYDNAKAINRTYLREQRISKINYKERYQTRKKNQRSVRVAHDHASSRSSNHPLTKFHFKNLDGQMNMPGYYHGHQSNISQEDAITEENQSGMIDEFNQQTTPRSLKGLFKDQTNRYLLRRSHLQHGLVNSQGLQSRKVRENQAGQKNLLKFENHSNNAQIKAHQNQKQKEMKNLSSAQFMREMGLDDIDMNALDEDYYQKDEREITGQHQPANSAPSSNLVGSSSPCKQDVLRMCQQPSFNQNYKPHFDEQPQNEQHRDHEYPFKTSREGRTGNSPNLFQSEQVAKRADGEAQDGSLSKKFATQIVQRDTNTENHSLNFGAKIDNQRIQNQRHQSTNMFLTPHFGQGRNLLQRNMDALRNTLQDHGHSRNADSLALTLLKNGCLDEMGGFNPFKRELALMKNQENLNTQNLVLQGGESLNKKSDQIQKTRLKMVEHQISVNNIDKSTNLIAKQLNNSSNNSSTTQQVSTTTKPQPKDISDGKGDIQESSNQMQMDGPQQSVINIAPSSNDLLPEKDNIQKSDLISSATSPSQFFNRTQDSYKRNGMQILINRSRSNDNSVDGRAGIQRQTPSSNAAENLTPQGHSGISITSSLATGLSSLPQVTLQHNHSTETPVFRCEDNSKDDIENKVRQFKVSCGQPSVMSSQHSLNDYPQPRIPLNNCNGGCRGCQEDTSSSHQNTTLAMLSKLTNLTNQNQNMCVCQNHFDQKINDQSVKSEAQRLELTNANTMTRSEAQLASALSISLLGRTVQSHPDPETFNQAILNLQRKLQKHKKDLEMQQALRQSGAITQTMQTAKIQGDIASFEKTTQNAAIEDHHMQNIETQKMDNREINLGDAANDKTFDSQGQTTVFTTENNVVNKDEQMPGEQKQAAQSQGQSAEKIMQIAPEKVDESSIQKESEQIVAEKQSSEQERNQEPEQTKNDDNSDPQIINQSSVIHELHNSQQAQGDIESCNNTVRSKEYETNRNNETSQQNKASRKDQVDSQTLSSSENHQQKREQKSPILKPNWNQRFQQQQYLNHLMSCKTGSMQNMLKRQLNGMQVAVQSPYSSSGSMAAGLTSKVPLLSNPQNIILNGASQVGNEKNQKEFTPANFKNQISKFENQKMSNQETAVVNNQGEMSTSSQNLMIPPQLKDKTSFRSPQLISPYRNQNQFDGQAIPGYLTPHLNPKNINTIDKKMMINKSLQMIKTLIMDNQARNGAAASVSSRGPLNQTDDHELQQNLAKLKANTKNINDLLEMQTQLNGTSNGSTHNDSSVLLPPPQDMTQPKNQQKYVLVKTDYLRELIANQARLIEILEESAASTARCNREQASDPQQLQNQNSCSNRSQSNLNCQTNVSM